MVLVHDTFSHCALEMYEFQPNSLNSVQLTERTKIAFSYDTRGIIRKTNMQEL